MSARIDGFSELLAAVEAFRDEREWDQFHTPKNLAAAIAVEAAEMQELLLWRSDTDELPPELKDELGRELADVLIHCANFASATGIEIGVVLAAKLRENAAKYPIDRARGSAAKYNKL